MEGFLKGAMTAIVIILLVVFLLPMIFSIIVIEWVGNFTNSVFIYVVLHLVIGVALVIFAGSFMDSLGILFFIIIGGTGLFFLLVFFVDAHSIIFGEGFDYSIWNTLDNWTIPIAEEALNG